MRTCLAFAIIVTAACGRETVTPIAACIDTITPSLVEGTSARFTWTPPCGLNQIMVTQAPSAGGTCPSTNSGVSWNLKAGTRLLVPAVDYGVAPAGSENVVPACPIEAGKTYRVDFLAPGNPQPVGVLAWSP